MALTSDLITAMNAARPRWSRDAYLASARLFPLPDATLPPADLDHAQRAAWHQANVDRTAQRELVEQLTRRNMRDELRELTADELRDRLQTLDTSAERGAAELQLIGRELRGRNGEVRSALKDDFDAVLARVELPTDYGHAAAVFHELDTLTPLLDANWQAVRTGDETAARNFEHAHFIVEENGKLVSLAESGTGRLTDRERWETSRQAEAEADAKATQDIARSVLKAAAGELVDIAAPQSA